MVLWISEAFLDGAGESGSRSLVASWCVCVWNIVEPYTLQVKFKQALLQMPIYSNASNNVKEACRQKLQQFFMEQQAKRGTATGEQRSRKHNMQCIDDWIRLGTCQT